MSKYYSTILNVLTPAFDNTYSMDFDGIDDYVDVFASATVPTAFQSIGDNNSYSISSWIKTTQAGVAGAFWYSGTTIVELRQQQGAGNHTPFNFGISKPFPGSSDVLSFGRTDDYLTSGAYDLVFSTATVNDGNWHHVAITIDNDDYIFYVDGSSAGSGTFSNATGDCSVATTTSNLQIGSRSRDGGQKDRNLYDGNIDELAIFNYKLTSGNVTTIYNSGVPSDLSSLSPIAWYRMGEEATWDGSKWTLVDQGSGGNNGESVNMVEADRETDVPS
jgi:hypothetical protein